MTRRETITIQHRDNTAKVEAEREIMDKDDNSVMTETRDNRAQTGLEGDKDDFLAETDNHLEETKAKAQGDIRITDKEQITREGTAGETILTGIEETIVGTGTEAQVQTTYIKETEMIGDRATTRIEALVETGISVETEITIEVETRAETGSPVETGTKEDDPTRDTQTDINHKVDQIVEAEVAAHPTPGNRKNVIRE